MKRIIRLTESDLTRIVRRVICESTVNDVFFKRRGIDIEKIIDESLLSVNPCKYAKLSTYFKYLMDHLILKLYLSNEDIKKQLRSETSTIEQDIKKYFINNRLDFIMYYYKLKCGKEPKY